MECTDCYLKHAFRISEAFMVRNMNSSRCISFSAECVCVCVSSFYGAPLDANIANTKTWKRRVDRMSILQCPISRARASKHRSQSTPYSV